MPDLEDYFGVDVEAEFNRYLDSPEFISWLDTNYPGDNPSISFALLNNDYRSEWDWRNPLGNRAHVLLRAVIWGDVEAGMAPDGTMQNVGGKLRFVLREGMDSVEAETNLHLVQAGDFPWQGAGTHRGFTGGVSGRTKREDWMIFCHLVDYLIDLMNQVAERAHATCEILRNLEGCPVGVKYMNVIALKQDFDPNIDLRELLGDSEGAAETLADLTEFVGLKTFAGMLHSYMSGKLEMYRPFKESESHMRIVKEHIDQATFAFAA